MRRFDEGTGAVGGGLAGAAGAAALDAGRFAEDFVLILRRDRFELAVAAVVIEDVEVAEAGAQVVAVAVVGGADLAEAGEAAAKEAFAAAAALGAERVPEKLAPVN